MASLEEEPIRDIRDASGLESEKLAEQLESDHVIAGLGIDNVNKLGREDKAKLWNDLELSLDNAQLKDKERLYLERDLRKWLFPDKHKDPENDSDDDSDDDDDVGEGLDKTVGKTADDNESSGVFRSRIRTKSEKGPSTPGSKRKDVSNADFMAEIAEHFGHYRTSIGSPTINRRSFTRDELLRFFDENDGFPLPSTTDELKAFDKQLIIESSLLKEKTRKHAKKRDRQRSKSATTVPDLSTIRLKLLKLQAPGKPKFLEHLINRVASRRIGKQGPNGLTIASQDSSDLPDEPLSPDSEKCFQHAEAIVEGLLACSIRPSSGESSDSGKGSLLESTSDFSPTSSHRKSWSTPASPTFQGIVKERLKGFQALNEVTSDSESVSSNPCLEPTSPKPKSFKNEEYEDEIREINKSIKQFYTALSNDESFNSAVMESGYVKALVAKINENKLPDGEGEEGTSENGLEDNDSDVGSSGAGERLKLSIVSDDLGWNEWDEEHGYADAADNKLRNSKNSNTTEGAFKSSRSSTSSSRCSVVSAKLRSRNSTSSMSPRNSSGSTVSLPSRGNSVHSGHSSKTNSISDSSESHDEDEKPKDKLHQVAYELLTTERAYVARLHLLEQVFSARLTTENKTSNFLPADVISTMFSNVQPIYRFHSDFLLPQLEERMKNWSKERKIGDIMAKLAPFLLLYTGYVKNYDNAMALIGKWTSQSPKFAAIIQEIQALPECGQLTLQHHMLELIQRVPRYELLLKGYLKHLDQDASDRKDAQKALDLVTQAAIHANTAMQKLDKFHNLLSIIPKLNGEGINDLVSPTRELVKEGVITKISARSSEKQARYIFLFNDLLLVCSEQIMGSYKVRAQLSVEGMQVLPGENMSLSNTFCVKCIEKSIEFLDEANNGVGLDWLATFQQVISDFQKKVKLGRLKSSEAMESETSINGSTEKQKGLGQVAPIWEKDLSVSMCMSCQDKFTAMKRRHHCRACGKVFCNKCSSDRTFIAYEKKVNRVCRACYNILSKGDNYIYDGDDDPVPQSPKQKPTDVNADKASIMSSYMGVMDKDKKWSRRYITVHDNFVMYFYKRHKDPKALQTLPLPGHTIKMVGECMDKRNVFILKHKDIVVCHFQTDNEEDLQQWVRILEKMVVLELPESAPKRSSTLSDTSSLSNQSNQSSNSSEQSS